MNVVDHRRFGAMSSARKGSAGSERVCGPAVAVCVGACASQPAALEAWRVLVWLITGKHAGREARTRRTRTVLQPLTTTVHVYNYISCTFYLLCVYVKYRSAC